MVSVGNSKYSSCCKPQGFLSPLEHEKGLINSKTQVTVNLRGEPRRPQGQMGSTRLPKQEGGLEPPFTLMSFTPPNTLATFSCSPGYRQDSKTCVWAQTHSRFRCQYAPCAPPALRFAVHQCTPKRCEWNSQGGGGRFAFKQPNIQKLPFSTQPTVSILRLYRCSPRGTRPARSARRPRSRHRWDASV